MKDLKKILKFIRNHILTVAVVLIMAILTLIGYVMSVITLASEENPDVLSYVNQNVFAGVAIHNIKTDIGNPDGVFAFLDKGLLKIVAGDTQFASGDTGENGSATDYITDYNSEDLSHIYKEHQRVSIDDVEKKTEKQDKEDIKKPDRKEDKSKHEEQEKVELPSEEEEVIGQLEPCKANNNYFLDSLFIGDSRTVGFGMYSNLPNITVYAVKAFQIYTVETKQLISTSLGNITVPQALLMQENRYKKVYLMFGLNEMGLDEAKFDEYYYHLIDLVKYTQKDAVVYVQGIIHVSSEKDADSSVITNARIDARNEQLRRIAEEEGVIFLDLNEVFTDANNALPANYASDGVHLKAQFINIWTDYLKNHAYRRTTWDEPSFETEFSGEQFPYVMNYYVPLPTNEDDTTENDDIENEDGVVVEEVTE